MENKKTFLNNEIRKSVKDKFGAGIETALASEGFTKVDGGYVSTIKIGGKTAFIKFQDFTISESNTFAPKSKSTKKVTEKQEITIER